MTEGTTVSNLTIRELARHFRRGDLSPVDVVTASLDRIEATDGTLHHFVEVCGEQALAAARSAEAGVRTSDSVLVGIPFAVKDIVDVEGLPTRCGSATRADAPPADDDAPVVAALRRAGGIMIGKTITQEFAAGTLSPPARNPWDPTRVPGGSSGGSAVAVATRCVPTAIGTDTGGSIRNPAAICGVVGLKPTLGTVPTVGVYPLSWSLDTIGPLAATVDDAWVSLRAMIGDVRPAPLDTRDLHGVRLGVPRGYFSTRLDPEVERAVEGAIEVYRSLGATIVEEPWQDAAAARASAFLINRIETVAVHQSLLRSQRHKLDLLNPSLRLRLIAGQFIPANAYVEAMRARSVIKDSIIVYFAEHSLDAVLTPVSPATAIPADRPQVTINGETEEAGAAYTRLTQPFNATGQPAISVPCGFDEAGLPVGLQIVGRPFAEQALCEIARAYGQATDWHQQRPAI